MAKSVGIPRGLYYYQYYPLWKAFFEELSVKVVVSDFTTKRILDDGVKSCVEEACLPVKLFFGHVINLKDKVDYLFIPRLTSVSKNEYICPKFGGLPDMVRHSLKGLPQIIDTEINLRKSRTSSLEAVIEIGSYFTNDIQRIINAYREAIKIYREYRNQVRTGLLPGDIVDRRSAALGKLSGNKLNIAVIGHVYNLYDSYINMDMLYKLRQDGIDITTVDMIDSYIINEKSATLQKKMFWYFGRKAMGSVLHILERQDIDGIIYVMTFGCGVDSFVCDLVERNIRRNSNTPFIIITIDEHSGEAGLNTRIEAFIDMIRWRKKDEVDVSAHG